MDAAQAKRLRRLARDLGRTESDVIRDGIDLVERRERRARAVEDLIAMITPEELANPPKTIKFRLR